MVKQDRSPGFDVSISHSFSFSYYGGLKDWSKPTRRTELIRPMGTSVTRRGMRHGAGEEDASRPGAPLHNTANVPHRLKSRRPHSSGDHHGGSKIRTISAGGSTSQDAIAEHGDHVLCPRERTQQTPQLPNACSAVPTPYGPLQLPSKCYQCRPRQ